MQAHLNKLQQSFKNLFIKKKIQLVYLVDTENWSIKWDGYYICKALNNQQLIKSRPVTSYYFLKNKVLHFGYSGLLFSDKGIRTNIDPSNKLVLTWFHVSPTDKNIRWIGSLNEKVDLIHTSCKITEKKLIQLGLRADKIVRIPLGVDTELFKRFSIEKRSFLKDKYQLPKDKIIIGSFQKDGHGWGKGLSPKLIKGPDLFCDAVEQLATNYNIHVLLTGPARGYVISRLKKAGISYSHYFINNYYNLPDFYNLLDLYLITSRVEGGPKALLECMATGIPLVATQVGMCPELIRHRENGLLCKNMDASSITENAIQIIEKESLKQTIINKALDDVKNYDWNAIAKRYYKELYQSL